VPPLVTSVLEIESEKEDTNRTISSVLGRTGINHVIPIRTNIELPVLPLLPGESQWNLSFFSFGTNDLAQNAYCFYREDVAVSSVKDYLQRGILRAFTLETIDALSIDKFLKLPQKRTVVRTRILS
jgi:pyruvate,orthophosphate dikinase